MPIGDPIPLGLEYKCSNKRLDTNVQSSIVPSSQKVETTHMAINGWMDKQNVVCAFNGILFNCKKWNEEVLIPATTWMDLENIMGSKRSQTQKATVCRIPFKGSAWDRQIHRDKKQPSVCQALKGRTNDRDPIHWSPLFSNFLFWSNFRLTEKLQNSIMIFFIIPYPASLMLSSFPASIQLIIKSRKLTMKQVINWTTELI